MVEESDKVSPQPFFLQTNRIIELWFRLVSLFCIYLFATILLLQVTSIHHISAVAGDSRCSLCIGDMSLSQAVPTQHLKGGQRVQEMPALGSCQERQKPGVRQNQTDSASLHGKTLFWLKRSKSPWGEQISNQYLTPFIFLVIDEPFFPLFQRNTWLYFPFNELLDQSPK